MTGFTMGHLILTPLVLSLLFNGSGASGCRTKQNINAHLINSPTPQAEKGDITTGELKVLAEGFHSSITDTFVAVIRDEETYSELVKLERSLPDLAGDFFESHVVIAAFLGQRNTGGYSVEIRRQSTGRLLIGDKAPGKGMMVPQMITSPFKIVSVSVSGTPPLQQVGFSPAFVSPMRVYRITRGEFEMTGGIAGVQEKFPLQNNVQVMREAGLATFWFTIPPSQSAKERSLHEVATGVVQSSGQVVIKKMSADLLVNQPNPGLKAVGAFTNDERKLTLSFDSLPTTIADGYSGRGSMESEIERSKP
jgi:PrcB C-terminal